MLTFFTTPRPFRGRDAVLQRDALTSWLRLHPDVQILLFGDAPGSMEIAWELGLHFEPHTTPLASCASPDAPQRAHCDNAGAPRAAHPRGATPDAPPCGLYGAAARDNAAELRCAAKISSLARTREAANTRVAAAAAAHTTAAHTTAGRTTASLAAAAATSAAANSAATTCAAATSAATTSVEAEACSCEANWARGTALPLREMFDTARRLARHRLLCYADSRLLLLPDFCEACNRVEALHPDFLMVGRSWDLTQTKPVNFDDSGWQQELRARVFETATRNTSRQIDYLAFSCGLFPRDLPRLSVNSPLWSNLLMSKAIADGATVVDATAMVLAVQQKHERQPSEENCSDNCSVENCSGKNCSGKNCSVENYSVAPGTKIERPRTDAPRHVKKTRTKIEKNFRVALARDSGDEDERSEKTDEKANKKTSEGTSETMRGRSGHLRSVDHAPYRLTAGDVVPNRFSWIRNWCRRGNRAAAPSGALRHQNA